MNKIKEKNTLAQKLSSILRKIKSSYTIGVHKHPLVFTVLGVLAINVVVLVVSAFIANSIDSTFNGVVDALARGSIKWLITPNSVLNIDNPKTMFLASVVVVLSMVLFSGVVIAMTTNSLKEYFEKKTNAEGNLFLEEHIIIFNWNSKVPQIVEDLVYADEDSTVLIYSSKDKEYIQLQINNVLRATKAQTLSKVNVIAKSGNPILRGGLSDISIENAKSIIIMTSEDVGGGGEDEISNADLFTLKTLISVGSMGIRHDCAIIVEVGEVETVQIIKDMASNIKSLAGNRIVPIAFNQRLGLFISQFILNPGLEKVFNEFFSFSGVEIYPIDKMPIAKALTTLDKATPIMESDKFLFVLSKNKQSALSRADIKVASKDIKLKDIDYGKDITIVLVGNNSKKRYILQTLQTYKQNLYSNIKLHAFDQLNEEFFTLIQSITKKCIIMILSDESAGIQSYDSNVYHAVIKLQKHLREQPNLHIIAELLDPVNHNIIGDFNVENTIVSNKLVGLLIAQLALNQDNYHFFENLMTLRPDDKEDFEIRIDYLYDILDIRDTLFTSRAQLVNAFYHSSGGKVMPLGIVKAGKVEYFCSIPSQEQIELALNDKLVYIQY